MDKKKIVFIVCVNDEEKFAECVYYLNHLNVPDEIVAEVFPIIGAASMTSGYNYGMSLSDAKYKVYLHQDVFIINKNFINDIIRIFEDNPDIGMLGMVGAKHVVDNSPITSWDCGNLYHNCIPNHMQFDSEEKLSYVEALDGLLLATQYDCLWRDDVFDGWDFYDASQCREFIIKGYQVAVPYQNEPWCYHDNHYSKMAEYNKYCRIYAEIYGTGEKADVNVSEQMKEFTEIKEKSRIAMEMLIDLGQRKELVDVFRAKENRGYLHLKEYEVISDIEYFESTNGAEPRFWTQNMDVGQLKKKLFLLKNILIREEFGLCEFGEAYPELLKDYSSFAISIVKEQYANHRRR